MSSSLKQKIRVLRKVKPINSSAIDDFCNEAFSDFVADGVPLLYKTVVDKFATYQLSIQTREDLSDYFVKCFYAYRRRFLNHCEVNPHLKHNIFFKILADSKYDEQNWKNSIATRFDHLGDQYNSIQRFLFLTTIVDDINNAYKTIVGEKADVFVGAEDKKGNVMSFFNQGEGFIHVKTQDFKKEKQPTECRFYLNLKYENIPAVIDLVMNMARKKHLPLYYKFSCEKRPEALLYYCSYEEADELLNILDKIKKKNPKLFDGAEKIPAYMGSINGYIGFAEEPVESVKESSYTSRLVDYINEVMKVVNNYQQKVITKDQYEQMRINLCEKYNIPRKSKYWFLNKTTFEELEKDGFEFGE